MTIISEYDDHFAGTEYACNKGIIVINDTTDSNKDTTDEEIYS